MHACDGCCYDSKYGCLREDYVIAYLNEMKKKRRKRILAFFAKLMFWRKEKKCNMTN